MGSHCYATCVNLTLSLSQLLTLLNSFSEEHIDQATALGMLAELGITMSPPLSLPPFSSQSQAMPPSGRGYDVTSLTAGFQRSMAIQDTPRSPSVSSTTSTPISPRRKTSTSQNQGSSQGYRASETPRAEVRPPERLPTAGRPSVLNASSPYAEGGSHPSKTTVGQVSADKIV